ncbi:MAG TPA: QueG-associated DUF1730 domain-containing protein [Acidisarcina sp.]
MIENRSIFDDVAALAAEAGFDAGGIAAVPEPGSAADYKELRNFAPWIEAGRAGEMEYLKRRDDAGQLVRSSLRTALPWARSVIVCAVNYNSDAPRSIHAAEEGAGWIARYAWTGQPDFSSGSDVESEEGGDLRPSDYHKVVLERLRDLEGRLRASIAAAGGGDFETRCYVDTGPVVERVYAKYAGVGWIGKNTCILNERLGSWLFLGVIVTSLDLGQWADSGITYARAGSESWNDSAAGAEAATGGRHSVVAADRCGSCTRCIDACPTDALREPYKMDASLCISYLTIEKRGEIAEPLRGLMGRQVFGCDICQDVCPWNRKAPIGADPKLRVRQELVNPALEWLASLDDSGFAAAFHGSPVKRTKLAGMRRNVAIAMGNSGLRRYLPQLEAWGGSDDAVLAETAAWAAAQIGKVAPSLSKTAAALAE